MPTTQVTTCPYCRAGEPSVWDDVLWHYAHPDGDRLKFCHEPWRERPVNDGNTDSATTALPASARSER